MTDTKDVVASDVVDAQVVAEPAAPEPEAMMDSAPEPQPDPVPESAPEAGAKTGPEPEPVMEPETAPEMRQDSRQETMPSPPPRPEPRLEPRPDPRPEPRGSALPMVLGGVVAAVIGFALAQVVPQGWPLNPVPALTAEMAAQKAALAALQTRLDELSSAPAPLPDPALTDRLTAVEAALAALPAPSEPTVVEAAPVDLSPLLQRLEAAEAQVASLSASMSQALSAAPTSTSTVDPAVLEQLRAEIEAMKSGGQALDAKMAEAEARLASVTTEAEAVATATAARAALRQVQAALDSGAPFASALADLPPDAVPAILTELAASGVPSLQGLRAAYPAAARAGLDAAVRADSGGNWTERLSTFLRGQTGARSLTPREGTDPDAVLSRAEAAMAAGDLTQALTELEGLPQAGKDAMAGWLAQAAERQEAVAAVQTLSTALGQ